MRRYLPGVLIGILLILTSFMGNVIAAQDRCAEVTLYIFSGRPDPTWTLSLDQTQAFRYIINSLPPGEVAHIPDTLGYRGFEIHMGTETIYVFGGHVQLTPASDWVDDPTRALEIWLLGTANTALEPDLTVDLWAEFTSPPQLVSGTASTADGFAIYLVSENMTPTEAAQSIPAALPHEAESVIQMDDITVYRASTHEFELTAEGQRKLALLEVPVSGLPFVVYVDGEAIYAGALWTSFSSLSYYESVVLDVLPAQAGFPLRLDLGYPDSAELYTGLDLRYDPRILAAFEKAGKLED